MAGFEIDPPDPIIQIVFGFWLQAHNGNGTYCDRKSEKDLQETLEAGGFHAYIDGLGFPRLMHWYGGPFEPGMRFVWEPTKDHAAEVIRITRVDSTPEHDPMVWSIGEHHKREVYNDMSRMREACLPLGRVRIR
jgi:hypothetical protein